MILSAFCLSRSIAPRNSSSEANLASERKNFSNSIPISRPYKFPLKSSNHASALHEPASSTVGLTPTFTSPQYRLPLSSRIIRANHTPPSRSARHRSSGRWTLAVGKPSVRPKRRPERTAPRMVIVFCISAGKDTEKITILADRNRKPSDAWQMRKSPPGRCSSAWAKCPRCST